MKQGPYEPRQISLEFVAGLLRDLGYLDSLAWLRDLHARAEEGRGPLLEQIARLQAECGRLVRTYERPTPHRIQGYRSPPESDG